MLAKISAPHIKEKSSSLEKLEILKVSKVDGSLLLLASLELLPCCRSICIADLSASLTGAYWEYFGGCIPTFSFDLEGFIIITQRLKICPGYVDNLIVFRLNK